jgi:hypothetical protein
MSNPNHRANAVDGLRALATCLEDHPNSMKMHEAGRTEITYCVLNADVEAARHEFTCLVDNLRSYGSAAPTRLELVDRTHEDTVQHSAELVFGAGTVAYQVLWIEKTEEAEDIDPDSLPDPDGSNAFTIPDGPWFEKTEEAGQ